MTPRRPARLEITCWCDTTVLWLPADQVRAGITGSCGLPHCHPDPPPATSHGRCTRCLRDDQALTRGLCATCVRVTRTRRTR